MWICFCFYFSCFTLFLFILCISIFSVGFPFHFSLFWSYLIHSNLHFIEWIVLYVVSFDEITYIQTYTHTILYQINDVFEAWKSFPLEFPIRMFVWFFFVCVLTHAPWSCDSHAFSPKTKTFIFCSIFNFKPSIDFIFFGFILLLLSACFLFSLFVLISVASFFWSFHFWKKNRTKLKFLESFNWHRIDACVH